MVSPLTLYTYVYIEFYVICKYVYTHLCLYKIVLFFLDNKITNYLEIFVFKL